MRAPTQAEGWLTKRFMLPLTVLLGVAAAIALVRMQPAMEHQETAQPVTPVTTLEVQAHRLRPALSGFGVVQPDILLNAKAEVSGKVVYVHPELKKGAILPVDTEVVRIDSKDYELALKQAQADLAISRANLKELDLNAKDMRADLKLANQKLRLAQQELQRLEQLRERQSVAQSSVDQQRSQVLQLQQEVQRLANQLETLPAQREVLLARIRIAEANAETQRRNLARTRIRLPFNARIDESAVEANQFVSQGSLLFAAQNIDKVIINAQFPIERFRILAKSFQDKTALIREAFLQQTASELFSQLGLSARVRLADDPDTVWPARVERFSNTLDPNARTVGVIVSVDHPYRDIQPGLRPPLLAGMYMEVILQGPEQTYLVVPRHALHGDTLYRVDEQQRLQRLRQAPEHLQGPLALYRVTASNQQSEALKVGDRVIVSDPFPALPGMALAPRPDERQAAQLARWIAELQASADAAGAAREAVPLGEPPTKPAVSGAQP